MSDHAHLITYLNGQLKPDSDRAITFTLLAAHLHEAKQSGIADAASICERLAADNSIGPAAQHTARVLGTNLRRLIDMNEADHQKQINNW